MYNHGTLKLITSVDHLPPALAASVSADERACVEGIAARGGLPFAVTPHFASLAGPEKDDPIRRQFMPDPREAQGDPFALEDPLGEACHRILPRLIRQYADRALLKTTALCGGFCRFCFRREWVAEEARQTLAQANALSNASPPRPDQRNSQPSADAGPAPFINATELEPVLDYLKAHPEIREILLSGGDPLTVSDERLEWLFQKLRAANQALSLRVCTRLPITAPDRITADLLSLLGRFSPLRLAVHINHSRELSPESRLALSAIAKAGIPVLVQTVLLKGLNDDTGTLITLFRECRKLGLTPYYLFQLDLAPGTAHFRVPLKQGLGLYRELQTLAPGTLVPPYAVDLPGGGGKIRLSEHPAKLPPEESIAGETVLPAGRAYLLKDKNGKLWPYPAD